MIIRQVCVRMRLSRTELARFAEVSPSTVGRIVAGTLDPTWGMLTRLLDAAGTRFVGDDVRPTGDPAAGAAAALVLDRLLVSLGGRLRQRKPTTAMQSWIDRFERAGFIPHGPETQRFMQAIQVRRMVEIAATVSGPLPRGVPALAVGDARHWREAALQIDEAGFDYAASGLAPALELPDASFHATPRIYVSDPAAVARVLRWPETSPERGVLLMSSDGPELSGITCGHALRLTSLGRAFVDACSAPSDRWRSAGAALQAVLRDRPWDHSPYFSTPSSSRTGNSMTRRRAVP